MADRPRSWGAGFTPGRTSSRVPAELATPIATTADGRDITQPWVRELLESRDTRLAGSPDWGYHDRVRLDDQVKSCMEQRIRAVVSRDWDVLPGDEDDARSVAAGDALKAALERVGWDRVTEKMLWATFNGYAVSELMWGAVDGQLAWVPTDRCQPIHVRHARRFRLDPQHRLRLLTPGNRTGELLPERKFWMVTAGGTDDDQPYGQGLAEWLYWPTLFKRNGVRFWNIFLNKLLAALQAIANDSGFVVPEGMAVELLHLAQSGADFGAVCRYMDGAIAKIILSQTMTTDNGSSRSQGEVHADVKLEVVKADADLLSDSFNSRPARWFTDLNFGADVASPRVIRIVEEEDDLQAAAATDNTLKALGWERNEESFRDRYGDGYERVKPPKPSQPGVNPAQNGGEPQADQLAADNVVPLKVALAEALAPVLKPRDVVDEAVDAAMADDGWSAVIDPLVAELQRATSPEEVAAILAREAELADLSPLTEHLARAGFALRMDALTDDRAEA